VHTRDTRGYERVRGVRTRSDDRRLLAVRRPAAARWRRRSARRESCVRRQQVRIWRRVLRRSLRRDRLQRSESMHDRLRDDYSEFCDRETTRSRVVTIPLCYLGSCTTEQGIASEFCATRSTQRWCARRSVRARPATAASAVRPRPVLLDAVAVVGPIISLHLALDPLGRGYGLQAPAPPAIVGARFQRRNQACVGASGPRKYHCVDCET
jgi:hypothetical protein